MQSVLPILPPAIALAAALGSLLAGRSVLHNALVAGAAQLLLLGVALAMHLRVAEGVPLIHPLGGWMAPVGIVFVADGLSTFLALTLLVIFSAAIAYTFTEREDTHRGRMLALCFLLEMGVLGTLLTGDAFDFYVFFELMGLSAYGLVGYRSSSAHVEAALKFATLSLVGSTLMLMGVGAIYAQTGQLSFGALHQASMEVSSRPLYLLAICLILTSLCLKSAIVPLHFWLPDAHSIAPTAISVILSGALVKVGIYGILRLLGSQAPWVWASVGPVLLGAGALTAIFGALVAVGQRDLKRLLAWSTASQMGYVLAAAALGSAAGVSAALVHLVAHAFMKSALFVGAGILIDSSDERRWDRMGGMLHLSPVLAAAMFVAWLSLAGIPPLAGFVGKIGLFSALLGAGATFALLCLLVASLAMIYQAVRVWLRIFGGRATRPTTPAPTLRVALATLLAGCVLGVGVAADPVVHAATRAAGALLDGGAYREAILPTPPTTGEAPP